MSAAVYFPMTANKFLLDGLVKHPQWVLVAAAHHFRTFTDIDPVYCLLQSLLVRFAWEHPLETLQKSTVGDLKIVKRLICELIRVLFHCNSSH